MFRASRAVREAPGRAGLDHVQCLGLFCRTPSTQKETTSPMHHESTSLLQQMFLTPSMLAGRWHVTVKTLANRRALGMGPPYVKIGGCVRYPLAAVEAHERDNTAKAA